MSEVAVQLTTTENIHKGYFTPDVGATVNLNFNPLKTSIGFDYSQPNSLGLKVEGELDLSSSLSLGLGTELSKAGSTVNGSLTWNIDKNISVSAIMTHSSDGDTMTGTLTLNFG